MLRENEAIGAFTRIDLQDHLLTLWADFKPTLIVVTHDVDEFRCACRSHRRHALPPRSRVCEIEAALPRPRDRQSAAFDFVKRRVRSSTPASPTTAKTRASAGAALW